MTDRARPSPESGDRGHLVASAETLGRLAVGLPGRRAEALAAVNGLFGDVLADQRSPLATPMTLAIGGTVLPHGVHALRDALSAVVPEVGPRICLLVHGLMCTESIWQFPADRATTFGTLLARDHGVTPVTLRYNTGRHVSANGRDLALLLRKLVRGWPVRVREIDLIGHSMGGLVIRSACHYATSLRLRDHYRHLSRSWITKVRRVVLVGTPNTGAPLEMIANLTSAVLWSLPVPATWLVGFGLDRRSAGIKDLRFGAVLDEDWQGQDPGAIERPPRHRVRPARRAHYLMIAGSMSTDPEHPLTRIIGDGLVTRSSATGGAHETGCDEVVPGATARVFPKVTHLALASSPEVYAAIDAWWLTPPKARSALRRRAAASDTQP
jgi:triacylglycerol lipase